MDGFVQGNGMYGYDPYFGNGYDMWYGPQEVQEYPQYEQYQVEPQMQSIQPQQYLNNYADMYRQSNPDLASRYQNLANQAGMWGDTQRGILNWYDGLANDVASRQQYVTDMSGNLANSLLGDINNQRDYIYSLYGPNGEITQQVNDYYSGLSNAISGDTARQLAQNDVTAAVAGVSAGANRNTQSQIYNEGYERALKAKEADLNAKNNIVSALQNYMSSLRQEYGDTTDKYIIQKYQQANDLLNQIQSSMTQDMVNLENAKLNYNMQRALSGGGGSSSTSTNDDTVIVDGKETKLSDLSNEQLDNILQNIVAFINKEGTSPEEIATAQDIGNRVIKERNNRTPDVTQFIGTPEANG